jgi:hypothetical protein
MGPDKIILRTVLLQKGMDFDPAAEIYGKDKMKWEKEVAHTFEVVPPQWFSKMDPQGGLEMMATKAMSQNIHGVDEGYSRV